MQRGQRVKKRASIFWSFHPIIPFCCHLIRSGRVCLGTCGLLTRPPRSLAACARPREPNLVHRDEIWPRRRIDPYPIKTPTRGCRLHNGASRRLTLPTPAVGLGRLGAGWSLRRPPTGGQTIFALTLYFKSYIPRYLHKALKKRPRVLASSTASAVGALAGGSLCARSGWRGRGTPRTRRT